MYSTKKDGNPKINGRYITFFGNNFDNPGVYDWDGEQWNPAYTRVDDEPGFVDWFRPFKPTHYIPLADLTIWKTVSQKPEVYGKYWVRRENGKEEIKVWNGSGWAYCKDVKYWRNV